MNSSSRFFFHFSLTSHENIVNGGFQHLRQPGEQAYIGQGLAALPLAYRLKRNVQELPQLDLSKLPAFAEPVDVGANLDGIWFHRGVPPSMHCALCMASFYHAAEQSAITPQVNLIIEI